MRWLVAAVLAALVSGSVSASAPVAVGAPEPVAANGSEPVAVSMPVSEAAAPIVLHDLAASSSLIARPVKFKSASEIRQAYKPKLAKKSKLKKSILSRTARKQMALLASKPQTKAVSTLDFFGDEDAESGIDNLDLHRFFDRPKLAKVTDQEDEDQEISEYAKLRLFLARTKAVEAHKAAQAADQDDAAAGLSEAVKLRLFLARMQAVRAHQKKFS